jgi:hypothetical protein
MSLNAELSVSHHRARVWFGTTAISDVIVPEETAARHAAAMCCRFASLADRQRANGGVGC